MSPNEKYVAKCVQYSYKMVYFAQWPKGIFTGMSLFGKVMLFYWEFHFHTSTSQKKGWVRAQWDTDGGASGFIQDTQSRKEKTVGAPKFKMPGVKEGITNLCLRC